MNKCIYSGEEFEDATKEHILQNFLGARWTDATIVCNEVQQEFGHTIDPGFEEGLKSLRTLLGVKGGRGGSPPPIKRAKSESGNEFHIAPGGKPKIASPIISEDAISISIQVANEDQLSWAIHQLNERHPHAKFEETELRRAARKSQSHLDEAVRLRLSLGGPNFFRGLCKAAFNLLAVTDSSTALRPELNGVRNFILRGDGSGEDYVGWVSTDDPISLPRLGDIDHSVGVFRRGGEIGGVVQLYGNLPFILRFCSGCAGDDFETLYVVNPFRDTEPPESRKESFNPDDIPHFDSCAHLPKEVRPCYVDRIKRILAVYEERADRLVISNIVHDVLGHKEGEIITEEDVNQLLRQVAEFIANRIAGPGKPNKSLDTNSPPGENASHKDD